jgi:hypothetical protein
MFDPTQLLISGSAQYHTPETQPLLKAWLDTIGRFPNVADNQSLDYAYNFVVDKNLIRAYWLSKDYCRYPGWIYVRPVIDHPQVSTKGGPSRDFRNVTGHYSFRKDSITFQPPQAPFPRDCLIDTWEKRLLRVDDRSYPPAVAVVGRFTTKLWIDRESEDSESSTLRRRFPETRMRPLPRSCARPLPAIGRADCRKPSSWRRRY